jgi:hypothetical protein
VLLASKYRLFATVCKSSRFLDKSESKASKLGVIWLKERVRGVLLGFMPTREQLKVYFDLTADLTKMYVSINLGTPSSVAYILR